jgi:hypothetical protein
LARAGEDDGVDLDEIVRFQHRIMDFLDQLGRERVAFLRPVHGDVSDFVADFEGDEILRFQPFGHVTSPVNCF